MFCRNCGTQNNDTSKFCLKCGSPLQIQQPVQPVPQQPVQPAPQQPVQPTPQQPVQPTPQPVQVAAQQPVQPVPQQPVQPTPQQPVQAAPQQPVQPAPQQPTQSSNLFQQSIANNPAGNGQQRSTGYQNTPGAQPVYGNRQPGGAYNAAQGYNYANPAQPVQKKSSGGKIAAIVLGSIAGIALIIGGLFALFGSGDDGKVASTDCISTSTVSVSDSVSDSVPDDIDVIEPVAEGPYERTVMVYMIGSNLESESGLGSEDIQEMLDAESSDGFKIVLQVGGTNEWTNPQIKDREVSRFEIENNELVELKKMGRISMVEEETLTDFIKYSAEKFPAEEYVLVMWNHGGSVPIGFGSDELFDGELTDVEIGNAIKESGIHFDSLIFNACEMCSLELFMSLRDSVDYVVAAESVVYGYGLYGSGIDYTSWINLAINANVSTQEYCEQILDDYVAFLDEIGSKGSMSVIRMDRIQEVYEAYTDYITAVYDDVRYNGAFADFVIARSNSGLYEGTDAVDISTLAGKYENDYSTALQNAVTNAVVRTKSDIPYGHGITAYCPYDLSFAYSYGRESLVSLDYDQNIIDFYDLFASQQLYYAGLTDYAGDWYVASVEDGSGGEVTHGEVIALDYTDMGSYMAIALTEADWDIVKDIKMYVCQDLGEDTHYIYMYGSDVQYKYDDNDYIIAARPKYWLFLNDLIPTSYVQSTTSDENGFYDVYFIYAQVNGEDAFIRLDSTSDNPNGSIVGYYLCDFDSLEYDDGHLFDDYDEVQFIAQVIDKDTEEYDYLDVGQPLFASDLTPVFKNLDYSDDEEVWVYYRITDVYENVYETDITTTSY